MENNQQTIKTQTTNTTITMQQHYAYLALKKRCVSMSMVSILEYLQANKLNKDLFNSDYLVIENKTTEKLENPLTKLVKECKETKKYNKVIKTTNKISEIEKYAIKFAKSKENKELNRVCAKYNLDKEEFRAYLQSKKGGVNN